MNSNARLRLWLLLASLLFAQQLAAGHGYAHLAWAASDLTAAGNGGVLDLDAGWVCGTCLSLAGIDGDAGTRADDPHAFPDVTAVAVCAEQPRAPDARAPYLSRAPPFLL